MTLPESVQEILNQERAEIIADLRVQASGIVSQCNYSTEEILQHDPARKTMLKMPEVTLQYEYITTPQHLREIINRLKDVDKIMLGVKATGSNPHSDRIRLLYLWDFNRQSTVQIIDFNVIAKRELMLLNALMSSGNDKFFYDAKRCLKFLAGYGYRVNGTLYDAVIMDSLLTSDEKGDYNLNSSSEQFITIISEIEAISVDLLHLVVHEVEAVDIIFNNLYSVLEQAELIEVFRLECDCIPAVAEMEHNGIYWDQKEFNILSKKNTAKRQEAQTIIESYLGNINIDSPVRLCTALKHIGIPVKDTSRESLTAMRDFHPVISAIFEYRSANVMLKDYGRYVNPDTGRIHATFNQLGAVTGRFSCSNPNLQGVSRNKDVRQCFSSEPGYVLVVADYSQIEMRVLAEITGDEQMIDAFMMDEDFHSLTASILTGRPVGLISKDERDRAKAVNFGIVYGMGAEGLMTYTKKEFNIELSEVECKEYLPTFFMKYERLNNWKNYITNTCHRAMREKDPITVLTLGGRRRIFKHDAPVTEVINMPIQGTAADIMKKALGMLPEALAETDAMIVSCIHDEVILEVPEIYAETTKIILSDVMVKAGEYYLKKVPVKVDSNICDNWAGK